MDSEITEITLTEFKELLKNNTLISLIGYDKTDLITIQERINSFDGYYLEALKSNKPILKAENLSGSTIFFKQDNKVIGYINTDANFKYYRYNEYLILEDIEIFSGKKFISDNIYLMNSIQ